MARATPMARIIAFYLLLATIAACAFWRGDRDSRNIASICILASVASSLVLTPVAARYSGLEMGEFMVDLLALAGFTLVALASSRFWPLWVSGLQLTTNLTHLMRYIDVALIPRAYATASIFWSYPILLILAIGTWRAHRRRLLIENC